MKSSALPAERTSAPRVPADPVRRNGGGADAYDVPLGNANIDGPKENAVALGLDGCMAWVEPSERFAMGYRVPAEMRDAGFVPTAAELAWGATPDFLDKCPVRGGWHPMNETTCEHCEGR